MSSPFEYRRPSEQEVDTMQMIAAHLERLYDYVQEAVPRSAERTLGIRKLQEARMWLNAAIVLNREAVEDLAV